MQIHSQNDLEREGRRETERMNKTPKECVFERERGGREGGGGRRDRTKEKGSERVKEGRKGLLRETGGRGRAK